MSDEPLPQSEIILYQTEDGGTRLQVRMEGETVWLTQKLMAELFQTSVPNVSMHIRNLFADGELLADSVVKEFLTTAADGKGYATHHHMLEHLFLLLLRELRVFSFDDFRDEHLVEHQRAAALGPRPRHADLLHPVRRTLHRGTRARRYVGCGQKCQCRQRFLLSDSADAKRR